MQNTIFFCLILCFTTTLEAQNERPRKNTSVGIDLIIVITNLADSPSSTASTIDVIYKENLEKSAMRFRVSSTSFNENKQQFSGFKADSTFIRSYYQPRRRYGVALGGEIDLTQSKHPMYAGLDVGFNFERGTVSIDRCLNQNCEFLKYVDAKSTSLEITPFIGWEVNLTERFFLNVELGPYLLFNFGDRPFADADVAIQTRSINDTEINLGRVLRDISINYRF